MNNERKLSFQNPHSSLPKAFRMLYHGRASVPEPSRGDRMDKRVLRVRTRLDGTHGLTTKPRRKS